MRNSVNDVTGDFTPSLRRVRTVTLDDLIFVSRLSALYACCTF